MLLHICNSVANNSGVLFFVCLLLTFVSVSTQSTIKIDTDFLTINSPSTLQAIEDHIFSPKVKKDIQKIFTSHVEHHYACVTVAQLDADDCPAAALTR